MTIHVLEVNVQTSGSFQSCVCFIANGSCAGVITTLVTEEHVPELLGIAQELKVDMHQAPEPVVEPLQVPDNGDSDLAPDVDKAKQGLEDIFNLY